MCCCLFTWKLFSLTVLYSSVWCNPGFIAVAAVMRKPCDDSEKVRQLRANKTLDYINPYGGLLAWIPTKDKTSS